MPSVLTGTRIIDLSGEHAAAVTGMLLADNGADVIIVEPPANRGRRRRIGEPVWDRGKQSVALDVSKPRGAAALRRLLADADVLIESYAPGTMDGWGLGYETLHHEFPRLIYCSITAYGSDSPLANRPASPALVEARTGSMTEQAGDRPGPHFLGFPMASYGAMFNAINGILAAIFASLRTGRGQLVEVSLYGGVLACSAASHAAGSKSGHRTSASSSRVTGRWRWQTR